MRVGEAVIDPLRLGVEFVAPRQGQPALRLRVDVVRIHRAASLYRKINVTTASRRKPALHNHRHSGGRAERGSPEPVNTGLWNMASGLTAARRPGMTTCCAFLCKADRIRKLKAHGTPEGRTRNCSTHGGTRIGVAGHSKA